MTEKQQEIYMKTKARLRRAGIENPADVIVALTEEIDYYRAKIHSLEEFIAKKRDTETAIVSTLRNKQSRDNRELLDRAANTVESQRAQIEHLTAENKRLQNLLNDIMKDEVTT